MKRIVTIGIFTATAVAGIVGSAIAIQSEPAPPAWVDPASGVVREDVAPPLLPVVNAAGEVTGYIARDKVFGGPDVSTGKAPVVNGAGATVGCMDDGYTTASC